MNDAAKSFCFGESHKNRISSLFFISELIGTEKFQKERNSKFDYF